jgi:hypothetical protein
MTAFGGPRRAPGSTALAPDPSRSHQARGGDVRDKGGSISVDQVSSVKQKVLQKTGKFYVQYHGPPAPMRNKSPLGLPRHRKNALAL